MVDESGTGEGCDGLAEPADGPRTALNWYGSSNSLLAGLAADAVVADNGGEGGTRRQQGRQEPRQARTDQTDQTDCYTRTQPLHGQTQASGLKACVMDAAMRRNHRRQRSTLLPGKEKEEKKNGEAGKKGDHQNTRIASPVLSLFQCACMRVLVFWYFGNGGKWGKSQAFAQQNLSSTQPAVGR